MREPSKDPKRLTDILEAIDTIFQYVGSDDFKTFADNRMRYHAVVYNMMIIGEAANMLTIELASHTKRTQQPNSQALGQISSVSGNSIVNIFDGMMS